MNIALFVDQKLDIGLQMELMRLTEDFLKKHQGEYKK